MALIICPVCYDSIQVVKNGSCSSGWQKYFCKECEKYSVLNPENGKISDDTKKLIDDLLLEKIPLAGIVRAAKVSKRWMQYYADDKYENVPRKVIVTDKVKGRLTVECDEMWSFVDNAKNKLWIWQAEDIKSKEIAGVFAGSRDEVGAQGLQDSLPGVYRWCAVAYTDFRSSYKAVFPKGRHRAVGKESGMTNSIESFNCTLRQRISRLVRKTLSFSKKLANHIGAIWYFIHHYNASLAWKYGD